VKQKINEEYMKQNFQKKTQKLLSKYHGREMTEQLIANLQIQVNRLFKKSFNKVIRDLFRVKVLFNHETSKVSVDFEIKGKS